MGQLALLSLFVVLGAFASILLNFNEAYVKKDFSFKVFVKQNWLSTVSNITVGIIICACTYDDTTIITMTKLTAFVLGAVAQQFFKKLCNIFVKSKPTFVGYNQTAYYDETSDSDDSECTDDSKC